MNQGTTDRILLALYCLSRDTCRIDATALGLAAGTTATVAAEALVWLERRGYVDATRARLTMLGLARASQLTAAASGGGRQVSQRQAKPRKARTMLPIAASNERPSKRPEGDEPVDDDGEPIQSPLEQPLYKPLYRPLREPLQGTQPDSGAGAVPELHRGRGGSRGRSATHLAQHLHDSQQQ